MTSDQETGSKGSLAGRVAQGLGGWRTLMVFAAVAVVAVFVRCVEVPMWDDPRYWVGNERLMASHDTYAWLAGAKGYSRYATQPLSRLVSLLHGVTGASYDGLGFWLPVLMAPLAALPLCLWLGRLGRAEAGLAAGLLASSGIGFLVRSRVGYLDTDVWSLFFAVGAATGFAAWMGLLRPAWSRLLPGAGTDDGDDGAPELFPVLAWALALGVFCNVYAHTGSSLLYPLLGISQFYPSGRPVLWALYIMCFALSLALSGRGRRVTALMGMAVFLAVWALGWWGLAASAAACAVARLRPGFFRARGLDLGLWLSLALLVGVGLMRGGSQISAYWDLLVSYWKYSAVEQAVPLAKALSLPSVMESIRESVNLSPTHAMGQIAGHWIVFVLAMLGLAFAAWRRPVVLVFLPLLGLGLASLKMGNRFTMYGVPVAGLGLGLGAADLLVWLGRGRVWRWAAQGVLCALAGLFIMLQSMALVPYPVLEKGLAETLVELRTEAPESAILWQWWDYGYAAQYYAERDTFGDGGRHSGDWLFPLALSLTTDSSLQSAQMMRLMGAQWAEQVADARQAGRKSHPAARIPYYGVSPMRGLSEMGPREAMKLVRSLAREPRDFPSAPPQYLVVAWDYLRFAGWISRYGTWDMVAGTHDKGRNTRLHGQISLDAKGGVLQTPQGPASLSRMTMVAPDERILTRFWPRFGGVNALVNSVNREAYVMDDTIYDSMMVRMLLDDPKEFEPQFELVVDNAPWARAYRVR